MMTNADQLLYLMTSDISCFIVKQTQSLMFSGYVTFWIAGYWVLHLTNDLFHHLVGMTLFC